MSADPATIPPPPRLPVVRWAVLGLLLLAEVGALSTGYDAADRERDAGWAGTVVAWTPAVFRWGLVATGLAAVLAVVFRRSELRPILVRRHRPAPLALAVASHLGAYALFALATGQLLGKPTALEPWELLAWLAAGTLTLATWALALVPPGAWPALLGRLRWVLLTSAGVALVASLVARAAREEWDVLSGPSMWTAYVLLQAVLPDVVFDPETRLLGTPAFLVEVGIPCSGYEGIGLMAVYLGVYLVLFRHGLRFPQAFLLIPLALAGVWSANVLRLVILIWIGDRVSPALALGGFHSQAGWIGFNAVALALLWGTHRSRLFTRDEVMRAAGPNPTAAYLAPLLAAVAVQMLAEALSPRPELLYPLRVAAGGVLLAYFWRRYEVLRTPGRVSAGTGLGWSIAFGVGVFLVWIALVPPNPSFAETAALPRGLAAIWVAIRVIGFVLVTPLIEELAFRGYLVRRLIAADFEAVPPGRFTWPSFLVSSALFGLMHGDWLAGILAGLAYGLVVVRTGRVRDAVVAHAVTNGLLLVQELGSV